MKEPTDAIAAAIAAAEERAAKVNLVDVQVQIASSGRPFAMLVPDDLTDVELMEMTAFVLLGLRPRIAELAGPRSRLVLPS